VSNLIMCCGANEDRHSQLPTHIQPISPVERGSEMMHRSIRDPEGLVGSIFILLLAKSTQNVVFVETVLVIAEPLCSVYG